MSELAEPLLDPANATGGTKRVLLLTPFPFKGGERYNVNVDATISRHSGAKTKSGVFFPTGLAYISSVLKQDGFDVQLADAIPQDYQTDAVLELARQSDILVMPVASTRYSDTTEFLKSQKAKIRIGISNFASLFADKLLNEDICDIIVHGEVEYTCLEVAKAYRSTGEPDLSGICGISYLDEGRVRQTPARALTKDLDSIPFPDREGMDHSVYTDVAFLGSPTAYVLTARGCPFKCTFCSTHLTYNYAAYYRSPENVVAEVEEVVGKHGVKNIYFIDDTFTLKPRRIEKICDLLIERELNKTIQWACLGRLDIINDTVLQKMKEAGCIEIRFGVESGNDRILEIIKKNLTVAQIERGVSLMKKHGIRYTLFFMLGNPGETQKTVRDTIRFAKKLNPLFASFNIATPLPGSPLYDENKDQFEFSDIETFNTVSSNYTLCELTPEELRRELKFAYYSYYLRPSFCLKLLSELSKRPRETFSTIRFLLAQARAVLS